ncbi:MAG: EAL domain-containing protein [Sulfurospirillaceae bacterium]|nr:EAL domain-containing protein [Sulfurospirillaceae bacterium]
MHRIFQSPKTILLIVFGLSFILLSFIVFNINILENKEERAKIAQIATSYSYNLKSNLDRSLSSTYTIAALLSQGDGVVRDFESVVEDILPFHHGVRELALAPNGIIQRIAPLGGNEKALGLNLFEAKTQNKESFLARDTGKLTLAGPLTLVQGGEALVGRLPIFLDKNNKDSFWGFILVVVRISEMFDTLTIEQLKNEGLSYEVWKIDPNTQQKQFILKSSEIPLSNPVDYSFEVPNNTWTISIAPTKGWGNPTVFLLREMIAVLFALILSYVAKLLVELKIAKGSLEIQVIQKTDEKIMLQKRLETLLDAIPDPIWLKDKEGIYLFCNKAFERLYNAKEEDIVGKSDYDFVDSSLANFFRAYDMIAMHAQMPMSNEEELTFKEDGYRGLFETIKTPVRDISGDIIGILGIARDITKRKENEDKIEKLEYSDALTGLPNKMLLNLRINHDMSIANRKKEQLAILFLDFDHFKNINDSLGHAVGDQLLIEVSKRLKNLIREEDTLSRQGGDEFVLVLPNVTAEGAAHVAKKLLQAIEQAIKVNENELVITASIGIAMFPEDGTDMETLFKCADAAMYLAKENGRNRYRFYTTEIQQHSARILSLENALRYAHMRGELSLHYQPQISLSDGKIIGAEALLRWTHPELGVISPSEFIPVAEESGQILLIGEWVLRNAAMRMKQWIDMGFPPMIVAVNLSAVQFHHEHLSSLVTTILDEVQLPPCYLELELTESVAAQNPLKAVQIMNTLNAQGIRLSIDDFGTGYSSLSYLKRFKVYKLKIDQSFIRDIGVDTEDRAIVTTIITLGKSLGLKTIAEGVETKEQLDFLKENSCDEVQGYYFSKPLNVEDFENYVRSYLTKEQQ